MADVHRLVRLRSALEAASQSVADGQMALAADGLRGSYRSLRHEVHEAIGEDLYAEFENLFPQSPPPIRGGPPAGAGLWAAMANQAKVLLETMAGWLDGIIESETAQERLRVEAEAYAKERVRQERGVGLSE